MAAFALAACGGSGDDIGGGPGDQRVPQRALPGPHAVACSNVAQDFSRVAPAGASAQDYWEGKPAGDGTPRYLGDLLSEPANVLSVTVNAPVDSNRFGSFAGRPIGFAVIACYPTVANNPRADFTLPTGNRVPHMHTGVDEPLFANAAVRYPVIAFSHGFAGSPLSKDHWTVLRWLASHGYVVVAPFHGDPRFADLRIDDLGDVVSVLRKLSDVIAMQALRPLAMSAALDGLLAHPQWRDHVDAAQIGGFGASMGGQTMLLMGGAELTTSPGLSSTPVGADPRIKAAVGYVPYFGQKLLPSFGREQIGLEGVTLPYLAIAGTADRTSPLDATQQGIERLDGPRQLVALVGVEHGFDAAWAGDILTWSLTFLDAQVRGLPDARAQLATMTSVQGGGDDRVLIPFD
jgi:predicted dienelactone hydrolase